MKIRLREQTLRLRLDQEEVKVLGRGESIERRTAFSPSSELICRVEVSIEARAINARFDANRLTVSLPLGETRRWASTEQVGIESDQSVGDGRSLHILIEKDFECIHDRDEKDANAFPNPRRGV